MPGKPHQSVLIPYENEIVSLRRRRPPVSYSKIADLLQQKYNLAIQAPAIFKFVKTRSRGRRIYYYEKNLVTENASPAVSIPIPQPANNKTSSQDKPVFDFPYSERYNLHRLPPEEAAARRKKLEEEGH